MVTLTEEIILTKTSSNVNNLTSLEQLSECTKLKELYLRKNYINDVDQVKHLVPLKDLQVLWLCDNPCIEEDEKHYRCTILKYLPWLKKLDHHDVTEENVLEAINYTNDPPATMPLKIQKRLTLQVKSNILTAILALVDELGEKELQIVQPVTPNIMDSPKKWDPKSIALK
ncbi:2946_t:CDS:2 [Diversispora eburnea]|uniref:2946_t:CDS:1 n=1 Tax=Diversispora eburnea TaxID=1213867 RepID=A0A9N8YLH6_9GLOM|nr:2946_t:CDS:2 [Diversispora eburnea]